MRTFLILNFIYICRKIIIVVGGDESIGRRNVEWSGGGGESEEHRALRMCA